MKKRGTGTVINISSIAGVCLCCIVASHAMPFCVVISLRDHFACWYCFRHQELRRACRVLRHQVCRAWLDGNLARRGVLLRCNNLNCKPPPCANLTRSTPYTAAASTRRSRCHRLARCCGDSAHVPLHRRCRDRGLQQLEVWRAEGCVVLQSPRAGALMNTDPSTVYMYCIRQGVGS